jgi:N-acetyl-gamma-glutamylphosphate reductase
VSSWRCLTDSHGDRAFAARSVKAIDLSGDFRLNEVTAFKQFYGVNTPRWTRSASSSTA